MKTLWLVLGCLFLCGCGLPPGRYTCIDDNSCPDGSPPTSQVCGEAGGYRAVGFSFDGCGSYFCIGDGAPDNRRIATGATASILLNSPFARVQGARSSDPLVALFSAGSNAESVLVQALAPGTTTLTLLTDQPPVVDPQAEAGTYMGPRADLYIHAGPDFRHLDLERAPDLGPRLDLWSGGDLHAADGGGSEDGGTDASGLDLGLVDAPITDALPLDGASVAEPGLDGGANDQAVAPPIDASRALDFAVSDLTMPDLAVPHDLGPPIRHPDCGYYSGPAPMFDAGEGVLLDEVQVEVVNPTGFAFETLMEDGAVYFAGAVARVCAVPVNGSELLEGSGQFFFGTGSVVPDLCSAYDDSCFGVQGTSIELTVGAGPGELVARLGQVTGAFPLEGVAPIDIDGATFDPPTVSTSLKENNGQAHFNFTLTSKGRQVIGATCSWASDVPGIQIETCKPVPVKSLSNNATTDAYDGKNLIGICDLYAEATDVPQTATYSCDLQATLPGTYDVACTVPGGGSVTLPVLVW